MTTDRTTQLPNETLVTNSIYGEAPSFPALVDTDELWNGAAIPRFRREVAEQVVDWVNATFDEHQGSARAYWDGDTVVVTEFQAKDDPWGSAPDRVEPDEDNRYCIGGRAWTWEIAG